MESNSKFRKLMSRIRDGSPQAVDQLIEEYGPHILRVVRRNLLRTIRSKVDSDDFVQSVWKSFFANRKDLQFDAPQKLVAYLTGLARNKVVEELRKCCDARRQGMAREQPVGSKLAIHTPGREPTPSQTVSADEKWQQILDRVPPHHRHILELIRAGTSRADAADELGVDRRTVNRLIANLDNPEPKPDGPSERDTLHDRAD